MNTPTTISRRRFALGLTSLVAGAALAPQLAFAQQSTPIVQGQDTLGHGEGSPADAAITVKIKKLTKQLIDTVNNKDGSAVQMVTQSGDNSGLVFFFNTSSPDEAAQTISSGGITQCDPLSLSDVRIHSDGFTSIEVTFTGFWPVDVAPQILATNRWYLAPDGGGGFLFDNGTALVPVVPKGMTSASAKLTLSDQGMKLDHRSFSKVDVVVLQVRNPNLGSITSGIYELPAGLNADDAQNQFIQSWSSGNGVPTAMTFIAKTPMSPQKDTWVWAVLVQPGKTYFVEQMTLDENGANPQPQAGNQYVTSFTVAEK